MNIREPKAAGNSTVERGQPLLPGDDVDVPPEGRCEVPAERNTFLNHPELRLLLAEAFPPTRELQHAKAKRRSNLARRGLIGMFEQNELPPEARFWVELLIESNAGKVPRLKTGRPRDPDHDTRRALIFARIQEELVTSKPPPGERQRALKAIAQNLNIPFNGKVILSLSYAEIREIYYDRELRLCYGLIKEVQALRDEAKALAAN
jgi:hypothetical protein